MRLTLVMIVQYMEDLSDREVAEAVPGRVDLKYFLSLPLEDEGFDYSVLSEFRQRLVDDQAEALMSFQDLCLCKIGADLIALT